MPKEAKFSPANQAQPIQAPVRQTLVVAELPTFQSRSVTNEEGTEFECVTVLEAQTEMLNTIRELKKSILG